MSDDRGAVIALSLRNAGGAKEGLELQVKIAMILGKSLQRSEVEVRRLIQSGKVPSLANAKSNGKGGATCILLAKDYDLLTGSAPGVAKARNEVSHGNTEAKAATQLSIRQFRAAKDEPKKSEEDEVVGFGVVQTPDGANIRDRPDTTRGKKIGHAERHTRVFVCRRLPGDWYLVRLDNGVIGYVQSMRVWINPPEPNAYLYQIKKNQGAMEIAAQEFERQKKKTGSQVNLHAWGMDIRHYARVLVHANHQSSRNGSGPRSISYENDTQSLESIKTLEGAWIWVPSIQYAHSVKGQIPQDSWTYKTYEWIASGLGGVGEFLLGRIAFEAGILHGALESVWDLVVGIVELAAGVVDLLRMVWSLIESLFTGKLFSFLKEVWEWVEKLSSKDNKELMGLLDEAIKAFVAAIKKVIKESIEAFRKKWDHENFLRRWHFRGWVIGYAAAEILMGFLSGGAAAVAKWSAKFGKLIAHLVKAVPKIKDFLKRAKELKISDPKKKQQLKDLIDRASGNPGASKGGQKTRSGPEASSRTDKGGQAKPSAPDARSNESPTPPGGENPRNSAQGRAPNEAGSPKQDAKHEGSSPSHHQGGKNKLLKGWDKFDPALDEGFKKRLQQFRGNMDLNAPQKLRGGEGQLFLSDKVPGKALKRWFKSRLKDTETVKGMPTSVKLLEDAAAAVEANSRLRADLKVVKIYEKGPDWVLRDFDSSSLPLGKALSSSEPAAAYQRVVTELRRLEAAGPLPEALENMLKKMTRGNGPSENIHWSVDDDKILVIDLL